ncbi:aminotransferase class I/II-fold pyridoxal phosphate-dependent enzyme [Tropicimonas sp. IMCC6043]|uniref:aminotransferase class I/II-fold pyridoxal phosphate-dependent enzyme n=1 Tax=Tropicimonas sp. IMCC6043 TaxID=2510645 RepID=UPI00101C5454|nr:aminotransferase class I/II-fold pyridoxal phosphate-dependent enzyme [Tropicimonas sp. IMCC6043]RYH09077.1 aminotransferase class I/II-fold pyridoxal phosphate-dependent enzyme [Tropicimonas sp. IMCC6043]
MTFPERFADLPEYAFPRLRTLLADIEPGGDVIDMTIGEPRHAMPDFVAEVLADNVSGFAKYPPNDGTPELRAAISNWVARRYDVRIDPETQVMALNGTREGLFGAAIALCPEQKHGRAPVVLVPNPFYQVYAVAALSVAAEPVYVPAAAETGFLPDYAALPPELLDRVAIAYVCSPSNPQGAVADRAYWMRLLDLAERHDFRIFADECYSEIYRDTPPVGALQVASDRGADPERVVIFHSLSKRSNLPGLRSGFVAGGPTSLARIRQLRAYAGAPLPLPLQRVAERVWADETHVAASLELYQEKYRLADRIFEGVPGYAGPEGGFFLWLPVEDGEAAARKLYGASGVRVLPGAYLGRDAGDGNPGAGFIRVAMVADLDEVRRGLTRLRDGLFK